MLTLLTIVHFVVSIFLIVIVLLQHGKGADMGAAFGGSGKTVFGTEGPLPLLNKITTASAIIFMLTSVTLAYYSANVSKSSVMKSLPITSPTEKKVEVAPKPIEVPMTDTKPTPVDNKGAVPSQFPGAKPPVTAPTPKTEPEASRASSNEPAKDAEAQPKEKAPPATLPVPGKK